MRNVLKNYSLEAFQITEMSTRTSITVKFSADYLSYRFENSFRAEMVMADRTFVAIHST